MLARVIAVADPFDALTTNRPYQRAHEPQEALRIIHSLAGKRLDPIAVAALDAVYQRGEIRIPRFVRTSTAFSPPQPAPAVPEVVAAAAAGAAASASPPAISAPESTAPPVDPMIETTRF